MRGWYLEVEWVEVFKWVKVERVVVEWVEVKRVNVERIEVEWVEVGKLRE